MITLEVLRVSMFTTANATSYISQRLAAINVDAFVNIQYSPSSAKQLQAAVKSSKTNRIYSIT